MSGSRDYTIRLWDARVGGESLSSLEGHMGEVSTVQWHSNGYSILSAGRDNQAKVSYMMTMCFDFALLVSGNSQRHQDGASQEESNASAQLIFFCCLPADMTCTGSQSSTRTALRLISDFCVEHRLVK